MSRAERFYRMCVTLPADEVDDERDENFVPELAEVASLRDQGMIDDAIEYGKAITRMYPDYDLIYYMIAHMYFQEQKPKEALDLALEAVQKCKRKFRLYSVIGSAEYDLDNVINSVVWWCRSVVAQSIVQDYQEFDPFLYLHYAADAVGANQEAKALVTMSDAIGEGVRFDDEHVAKMKALKKTWARKPFKEAIESIVVQYLA